MKSLSTIGVALLAQKASSSTGSRHGVIACGSYPLEVSTKLSARKPDEVDRSLLAHLALISGQPIAFEEKLIFPNNESFKKTMQVASWELPSSARDECRAAIAGSMRSASGEELGKALYRLRILTRGREQRSDEDREAEAVIWIEQLQCWPGDIVIEALRRWPSRKDGQWWPTWHEVEAELKIRTSLRQALMNHLQKPPAGTRAPAKLSADQRIALVEKHAAPINPIELQLQVPTNAMEQELTALLDASREPLRASAELLRSINPYLEQRGELSPRSKEE